MKNEYTLNIHGRSLTIRSDEDEDNVRAIESLVNERLSSMGGGSGVPMNNALLLTCLALAQELIGERETHQALKEKIRSRSNVLLEKLDAINFAAHVG